MWKCKMCGSIFSEPDYVEYCCEDYAGVSSMFADRHYSTYPVCPYCGDEDIVSYWEEDDDE